MSPIKNDQMNAYTVKEDTTLLPFLLEILANKSRNAVKSILTRGQVSINGQTITQHNHPLAAGQTVHILGNQASIKLGRLTGIRIIHEDDALIVIDKDAGVLSMASKNPDELNAYRQLTDYVKFSNPSNRIFIVHRLDRDTSGVMIFAKSEAVKDSLQENWQKVVKKRQYTALVEGAVAKPKGTITSWLSESKTLRVYSTNYDNGGKRAVTHYKKIAGNDTNTLLEVELDTGRKNQIRVHFEDLGHPVVGDKKYGARTNPLKRLGLHATALELIHPTTHKLVRYAVKPPKSFTKQAR